MSSRSLSLSLFAFIAGVVPALSQTPTSPGSAAAIPPAAESTPTPAPAPTRPPFVAGYRNGFSLASETGDFQLRITGYTQSDGRFALGDDAGTVTNQFLLRRVRPILQGTVAQYFDFYLVPDFGGGTTVLFDAYIDTHFTNKLRFRAGKLKSPFGIERLQSGQALTFVERALPNNLVPNRDVGLQVWGELGEGAFTYQAAVLNGVTDGGNIDGDTNDGKDLVGRVFLQPWKTKYTSPLRGLGFGVAASQGKAVGAPRGYSSVSQVNIFSYATTVTANGDRTRFSPQGWLYVGPFGVLAEYVQARHDLRNAVTGQPAVDAEFTNSAWSVTGTWFVTGEDASYGASKPKNFLVPTAGKWGALQLVARVNSLEVDEDAFSAGFADPARSVRKADAWGVGANWIWNNNLKLVLDYEQTRFEGGAASGGDRPDEKSVQTRLQLSF
jgi:phosphate-selective porin OprO and OprP